MVSIDRVQISRAADIRLTWVGKDGRSAKRTFKDPDRGQDESRSDLDQAGHGRSRRLKRVLFDDLQSGSCSFKGKAVSVSAIRIHRIFTFG